MPLSAAPALADVCAAGPFLYVLQMNREMGRSRALRLRSQLTFQDPKLLIKYTMQPARVILATHMLDCGAVEVCGLTHVVFAWLTQC